MMTFPPFALVRRQSAGTIPFAFGVLCLSAISLVQAARADEPWLRPKALRPGDTVALVAPAGPVKIDLVRAYAQQLEQAGYKVRVPETLTRVSGFLAGTDDERVNELNAAIRDPKVRAIFPCRGGYGLTRILDRIDYAALKNDPKIITGFSDITALHLAVSKKCRLVTFHSPMPQADLWQETGQYAYASQVFRQMVFASPTPIPDKGFTLPLPKDQPAPLALVKGKGTGRLTGGNLSLICATLGTPFEIEADGNLLFIEDLNESPYRIDRFLSQLRLAGIFQKVNGVIVGDFHNEKSEENPEVHRVLREYLGQLSVPVVTNFPIGHIPKNATLPCGVLTELDASNPNPLRLLENPCEN